MAAFTVNVKPYLPEAHTDKEENKDNMYFNIALDLALANNDEMLKSEDIANSVKILGFEPDAEKIDWYANRKFIGNDEQKEMIYPKDANKRAEKFFWIAAELLQAAEIEPNNDNLKQFLKAAGIKNKILLERVEMAEPVIVIDAKL